MYMAKEGISLAMLLKEGDPTAEEAEVLTAKAMEDVKLASLCLKHAALYLS